MFPLNSPPDLRAEYQARLEAALRNQPRESGAHQRRHMAAWLRVLAERIAQWLRRARRPQPVERMR